MLNFKQLGALWCMLEDAGIPNEVRQLYDGFQIAYPSFDNCVCDIILHQYSYGCDHGLLEIMGLLTDEESDIDSVLGWLTAEQVFDRIRADWEKRG